MQKTVNSQTPSTKLCGLILNSRDSFTAGNLIEFTNIFVMQSFPTIKFLYYNNIFTLFHF